MEAESLWKAGAKGWPFYRWSVGPCAWWSELSMHERLALRRVPAWLKNRP